MYLFWRLFHLLNILKNACWFTFGRYFLATLLASSAALVAIGIIAAVAKIAFDEQSWVASLLVGIIVSFSSGQIVHRFRDSSECQSHNLRLRIINCFSHIITIAYNVKPTQSSGLVKYSLTFLRK